MQLKKTKRGRKQNGNSDRPTGVNPNWQNRNKKITRIPA